MHRIIEKLKSPFSRKYDEKLFSQKRTKWLRCINGDDPHSIIRQIYKMIWDAAAFRVVNEIRRISEQDEDGSIKLNGMVQNLINRGFVESQVNAIRRLADVGSEGSEWSVYSLRHLIDDMDCHRSLFIRHNIFAAEGLYYDYERVRDEQLASHQNNGANRVSTEKDWVWSKTRHKHLDILCSSDSRRRSPHDRIVRKTFKQLRKMLLDTTEEITKYANKFISHAASPESRDSIKADEIKLTFQDLWKAHETICRLTNYISVFLLGSASHGFLAIPQYNQFKYIERPWINHNDLQFLNNVWDDYRAESESWNNSGIDMPFEY